MSNTYRIEGVKYNPANWAGLEPSERAACARFAAARERELNTITATSWTCHGGPFDGHSIEIESTTNQTAVISVGRWAGRYEVTPHGDTRRLEWVGNDAGAPVNTHGTAQAEKKTGEVNGRGFGQLRDLLAELAEDPAERAEIVSCPPVQARFMPGHMDDFGNHYCEAGPGKWTAYQERIGRRKGQIVIAADHVAGPCIQDDFGMLTPAKRRPAYLASYSAATARARYTIGRTTYTIPATAEAVAKLRARIVKAKRWFSDKLLTAPREEAHQSTEPAPLADPVAQLVADAMADAAIATARGDAPPDVDATPQHDAAEPAAPAEDAHASDAPGPVPCLAMAETDAPETAADATAQADAPSLRDAVAQCLATLANIQASSSDATGPSSPAPQPMHASSAPNHAIATGWHMAPAGRHQVISSRAGSWTAASWSSPAGPMLEFEGPDGSHQVGTYASRADMLRDLARLAAWAESAHGDDEQGDDDSPDHAHPVDIPPATGPAASTPADGIPPTIPATAPELDDTPRFQNPGLLEGSQDLNPENGSSGALHITLTRGEGPADECGTPHTLDTFAQADALLFQWSETAPAKGGYDKCDFRIVWPDGDTYAGRYDLVHHSREAPSLAQHIAGFCEFLSGDACPDHMTEAAYRAHLADHVTEDQREDAAKVLQRLRELAGWFPRFRPVAIDPRAIIERAQASPDVLMGFGVTFSGGRFGTPSTGAIIHAQPCSFEGLRLVIRTEDGAEHFAAPRDFTDSGNRPALFRFDGRQHGAPYLAQLAAAVASKRASETASKELAAQAFQRAKAELLAAHPDLVQTGDGMHALKAAATNIRRMLKAAFPGVKFSVRSESFSGGNSIDIRWTDGPRVADVDAIVDPFSAGSFNGMDDSYTYKTSPWTELFGSAKYVHSHRDYSDETIAEVITQEWPNPDRRPTVADYHAGRMWQFEDSGSPTLWPALNRWTAPQFRPVSA